MRRERTEEIIRKRVSAMWNELVIAKEVSRALAEALQDQIVKNQILEDLLKANKAE